MFKLGYIVELFLPCLGNEMGQRGIVYEEYGQGGCSVIFPNGNYDGFSVEDQRQFLRVVGKIKNFKYKFENVIQLQSDYRDGYFKDRFEEMRIMNQITKPGEFSNFEEQLTQILQEKKIDKSK